MELYCYHNSREKKYRLPHGALAAGEKAVLRIRLWGDAAVRADCTLRLWADEIEHLISGSRFFDGFGVDFVFEITAPSSPQLIWYHFIIKADEKTLYYGAKNGVGSLFHHTPPDYQITVYDKCFKTPDWFKQGVVYQIFPDRFCRGSEDESGQIALSRLEYHKKLGRKCFFHKDFEERAAYLPYDGEKDYSPCDYFGGDLDGIRKKLPYIASFGTKCIYLNPIFEAASNHRYNTSDYLRVDPVLGDEDALSRLVEDAASFGIRIMLDGVFSHTGDDSVYFNKYGNYSSIGAYQDMASPYFSWYDFESYPDKYRCWWGFKTLPEVNESVPSYAAFIESVMEKWAKLGLTSWRLDVADELPDEFIKRLRSKLKSLDESGVLLGEVWDDASNKTYEKGLRQYVYGHELDSVMNYPFRYAVVDFFIGKIDAYALNDILASQRENYPEEFYLSCMNILGSHDSERILTALGASPGRALSREAQAEFKQDDETEALARKRLFSAAALQFSMPQPPAVYYGDEAGMRGMFDPFNRETYPWGKEDPSIIAHYRLLGSIRSRVSALHSGKAGFCAVSEDVFSIIRADTNSTTLTIINRGTDAKSVCISCDMFYEGPDAGGFELVGEFIDAFNGMSHTANGELIIKLGDCGCALLVSKNAYYKEDK